MSHERIEPLTDAALDREIDAALSIDPSPEFLARLRTQVAQIAPGRARLASSWVAAAALAAAVVAVVTASMTWRTDPPVLESSRLGGHGAAPLPVAGHQARSIAADAPHVIPTSAASAHGPSRRAARAHGVRPAASGKRDAHTPSRRTVGAHGVRLAATGIRDAMPHEAEVLVARDESAAFHRLLTAANQGRVSEIPLAAPEIDADTGTIRPRHVSIAPIQIALLAEAAGAQHAVPLQRQ